MDKYKTNLFLRSQGFAVPDGQLVSRGEWRAAKNVRGKKELIADCRLPAVIKPYNEGCSIGVHRVTNGDELVSALDEFFNTKEQALVEECLSGMELTVGLVGNEKVTVLPASLALATGSGVLSIEDKFLPGHGENQTPAPLNEYEQALVQHTVSEVYKAVGCAGYARIDCFYQHKDKSPTNEDRVVILEINTLPGLTPATCLFHQAAEIGMRPTELLDTIVELGCALHQKRAMSPVERTLASAKEESFVVAKNV